MQREQNLLRDHPDPRQLHYHCRHLCFEMALKLSSMVSFHHLLELYFLFRLHLSDHRHRRSACAMPHLHHPYHHQLDFHLLCPKQRFPHLGVRLLPLHHLLSSNYLLHHRHVRRRLPEQQLSVSSNCPCRRRRQQACAKLHLFCHPLFCHLLSGRHLGGRRHLPLVCASCFLLPERPDYLSPKPTLLLGAQELRDCHRRVSSNCHRRRRHHEHLHELQQQASNLRLGASNCSLHRHSCG
mmetsp:Transcript_31545/g.84231  ORF Transcript_31545/g.84231 Transcript_31545/m.84231 type:complete len:239 (-) Transcript_31545:2777-3493(-)